MSNFTYSDELYHFGIQGMKWGIRRFQNEDGTRTPEGKIRYGGPKILNMYRKSKYGLEADNEHQTSTEKHVHFYDKPKAVLDASLTATFAVKNILEAAGGLAVGNIPYALVNMGMATIETKAIIDASLGKLAESKYFKDREGKPIDKKTGLVKKSTDSDPKEDLKVVNPAFKSFNDDKSNNCMLCTTTYDLRRRGFDVTAGVASYGYTNGDIKRWYPKAEIKNVSAADDTGRYSKKNLINNTISELSKQGNSRGNILVGWEMGGGHSMVYEVSDGKVRILDAQSNKIYDNPEKILKEVRQVSYTRLDNVEPDYNKIKECVR